ncbi:Glutamine synthetase [Mycena indigotica]|uniref:Glutamine synthetase n=1 Tax=Mycena indigotica TaxID=2126181 RepID=A0A8H6W3N1_9AGAR|nr:Glutamine synthetase [Mycena indigotica]KAF7301741.1 Glutamine synthetase [Mycena indigotica]
MPEFDLAFSASLTEETGHFKLLELPTEICALVENSLTPLRFSVKGQSSEDAVLCTPDDKTYTIRSVVLSNNILVVTSDPENDAAVVVRDQLTEILELTPTLPKLEKLTALLRGRDLDDVADNADGEPEPGISYEDAKSLIQASDGELASTLRKRRILDIRGKLRPIAPSYLTTILETILNHIVAQGLKPEAVPASELSATLADENEISVAVSMQVMTWFGNLNDGVWVLDVPAVHEPLTREELLRRWKLAVGDTFEASVALDLLSGNYLETASTGLFSADTLTYFPSSALPVEPASRFADLFLTRQRWRAEDISPFLSDIALNNKERDKLLLKYTRTTTDSGGQVYYTKR